MLSVGSSLLPLQHEGTGTDPKAPCSRLDATFAIGGLWRRRLKDAVEYWQAVTGAGGRLCIMCQGAVTAAAPAAPDATLDSMIDLFCGCETASPYAQRH